MRTCLFSFVRIYEDSMVASQRIAQQVSKILKLPITTDKEIEEVPKELDALLIVNGAYAFCRCLPQLGTLIESAKRVIWIQNDYTIIPPKSDSEAESPFRAAFRTRRDHDLPGIDYWTTCGKESKATDLSTYVNWNVLTFNADALTSMKMISLRSQAKAQENLLYYGSFRNVGRLRYFDKYFKEPQFSTVISSPLAKGKNRFAVRYQSPKIKHVDKITENFYEFLCRHTLGLYLEDRKSHEEYHSPPNRFYEMLSASLPIVFQPEAGMTLRKAGYEIAEYAITNIFSLKRLMNNSEDLRQRQREMWLPLALVEQKRQVAAVKEAWSKLEKAS